MKNTKAKQKRRSYSINDKLAVIAEHEEGVAGSGFYALSNKHDVASGTLRGWWQNRQKLQDASKDRQIATRTARRLGGGGRGPKYPEVEERLHLWILDRNAKGLRVKVSYIHLQAQNIYRKLRGPDGLLPLDGLRASRSGSNWCHGARRRHERCPKTQPIPVVSSSSVYSNSSSYTKSSHGTL
ncbi:hypothetical protein PC129_g6556 [Phytophthora cactorum]|uniref:HTH CENPB-type domain-containing protein n=1 Tax=Phytophthora cactorum TaxID=29920 RepID=A0A8T1FTA5_9STRA|nr:hypothetical protein Pcac1_g9628 [Phytophthora cactorum]KAG2817240.1 hypothetical protein PC112_g13137 [Phytophthora cactorum]KAG2819199.1 hypothetical protein PC111_g11982 [Phytophthora cactorum]KAG2859765.1 hypothetical protein PC113_g8646 [Phytophthora cactorum]KAG2898618.1 hypothetical protein PC114_g14226 [Phytophthora cactorum]